MDFSFLKRKVFEYTVKGSTNSSILHELVTNGISVTAFDFSLECNGKYLVRIVVGLPANTSNDKEWNKKFETILRNKCVEYTKSNILEVIGSETSVPGVIYSIFNSLYTKLTLEYMFLGENTNIYVKSDNICLAQKILNCL